MAASLAFSFSPLVEFPLLQSLMAGIIDFRFAQLLQLRVKLVFVMFTFTLKSIMIPAHLSNPSLVSLVREMLQASLIFPSHLVMFSSSLAPSLALVELYRPAQIGDFLARALSPPKDKTSSFIVLFKSPLLSPFLPARFNRESNLFFC